MAELFGDSDHRFQLIRRVGAGGFGAVFEAVDRERGETVAVKVLTHTSSASLYRFKKGFRTLCQVSHPNLVPLYELFSDGEQWYFTMQLVPGVSLLEWVWQGGVPRAPTTLSADDAVLASDLMPSEPGRADIDRIRDAFRQLAAAVAALHDLGMLHRDLKPPNVLVRSDGRLVVLDFGLVTEVDPALHEQSREVSGTPEYMAPEHLRGEPLTESTDWYSVGVMLYEALTGTRPGVSIRAPCPQPPNEIAEGVPDDLASLCMGLLDADPATRAGRVEVAAVLGPGSTDLAPGPTRSTGRLVGRAQELALLRAAFDEVRRGQAAVAHVTGPSGIGKSRLVRDFLAELTTDGAVTLAGRCHDCESVPFKALDAIIDDLSRYLGRISSLAATACVPVDIDALSQVFPVLERVDAIRMARRRVQGIPDAMERRRRAIGALRELLVRIAHQVPLVIWIDDFQWGDADSATFLAHVLRSPDPPPLLLVLTYRDDTSAIGLAERMGEGAAAAPTRIALGALTRAEAIDLSRELAGPAGVDAHDIERIASESEGSPFFVDALVRFAAEAPGGRPVSLDDVLGALLERLPRAARRLLEVVAVAGGPVDLRIALAAASAGRADLEALNAQGLVVAAHDRLATSHDRIREAAVAMLIGEPLRSLHHRLALALEEASRADLVSMAQHFRAAGVRDKAQLYAGLAGDRAARALAFDNAARHYAAATELATSEAEVRRYRMCWADALCKAGRGEQGGRLYLELARDAPREDRQRLERLAAEHLLLSGYLDEGRVVLDSVLARHEVRIPRTELGGILTMLAVHAHLRVCGVRFRPRDASEAAPVAIERVDALQSAVDGLGFVDPARAAGLLGRLVRASLVAGEPKRIARALLSATYLMGARGHGMAAQTDWLLEHARRIMDDVPDAELEGVLAVRRAVLALLHGQFGELLPQVRRALKILREQCVGVRYEIDTAIWHLTVGLAFAGEIAELTDVVARERDEADHRRDQRLSTLMRNGYATLVHLAMDDPGEATVRCDEAMAMWPHDVVQLPHYLDGLARGEIALYTGRDGVEAVEAFTPVLVRRQMLYCEFMRIEWTALRGRCALAAGQRALAERVIGQLARERAPWAGLVTDPLRAGLASLDGDHERAGSLLRRAEESNLRAGFPLRGLAAALCRGLLTGDDAVVRAAREALAQRRVVAPERLANALVPGRWTPSTTR